MCMWQQIARQSLGRKQSLFGNRWLCAVAFLALCIHQVCKSTAHKQKLQLLLQPQCCVSILCGRSDCMYRRKADSALWLLLSAGC
jgi:hypothetical protein